MTQTPTNPQPKDQPDTAEAKIREILFNFARHYHQYMSVYTDEAPLSEPYVQQLKGLLVDARIDELEHMECCDIEPIKNDFVTNICHDGARKRIAALQQTRQEDAL